MRKEDEGPYECQIGISTAQPVGRMIYLKVIGEIFLSFLFLFCRAYFQVKLARKKN